MQWRHPTLKYGRISFDLRESAEIANWVFEAPDGDPALETRLRSAGCRPLDEVTPAPLKEEDLDGAPTDNEKRKTDRARPKKGGK